MQTTDLTPTDFEQFIIQCCAMNEWDLRDWLQFTLANVGFTVQQDNYRSYRGERYGGVHNMLAIRGNPAVCLVAHTDVCRDHGRNLQEHLRADPIVKTMRRFDDTEVRIVQDRHCKVQTGGDDRLGVAINTWIALHSEHDLGLLFTTDEEAGLKSAEQVKFPELQEFELLVQVDRGNYAAQLVTNIGGTTLCSKETAKQLLEIAANMGVPRQEVMGMITDVLALVENGQCSQAVNLTCGYYNSHGQNPEEYINVPESLDTRDYVLTIVEHYNNSKQVVQSNINESAVGY